MRLSLSKISLLSAQLLLSGCCHFTPCHPGSYITGTVTDAVSHQGIANASVRLYHHATHTAPSGCFALGGADAFPFEFRVAAPGYKPVAVEAVPGSFQAMISLVPEGDAGESKAEAREIAKGQYSELSRSCF